MFFITGPIEHLFLQVTVQVEGGCFIGGMSEVNSLHKGSNAKVVESDNSSFTACTLIDMITGPLELLFGEDDMEIVSIHIGVLTYMAAVKRNVRYTIAWLPLEIRLLLSLHVLYLPPLPPKQNLNQSLMLL
jgi:hypothetical protein